MPSVEHVQPPARGLQRERQRQGVAVRVPPLARLVAVAWLVALALSTTYARDTLISAEASGLSDPPTTFLGPSPGRSAAAHHRPPQQLRAPRTAAVCTPQLAGWSLAANATLDGIGYLAAAIPVSRHILVLGGIAHVRDSVDAYTYLTRHTQRRVNLVNPRTYAVHAPLELVRNVSSTVCPIGARCIEPVNAGGGGSADEEGGAEGLVPVSLLVPVVGAGSVVELDGGVYAIGACNTVPDAVRLDQLRADRRRSSSSGDGNDGVDAVADSERVTPTPSPQAQAVEDYLRSVLRIRPFQKKFAGRDAHVLHQELLHQPPSMTLRLNATCVSGASGVVYIIGGVNARTGEALASVAQYDIVTNTFVEGVWSLDAPVMTAAATSDNGLMFIAGGFSVVPDPSLFNPSRTRRKYHTSVAVVDTHRDLYDAAVAQYATATVAEQELQWTAPQLFAHGAQLYMLGSASDASAYRRLAYWEDMSASAGHVSGRRVRSLMDGAHNKTGHEAAEGLRRSRSRSAETSNPSGGARDEAATVFELGAFAFAPSRQDAALAMVPMLETPGRQSLDGSGGDESAAAEGSRTVKFFLLGGRLPPAAGGDAYAAEQQVFVATVTLCEGGSGGAKGVAARNSTAATAIATATGASAVQDRAAASLVVPRVLGFSYARVMAPAHPASAPPRAVVDDDDDDIPNQDGSTAVYVNGHEPLWYNFSFSVLLPLRETAAACPGVVSLTSPTANASDTSSRDGAAAAPSYSSCSLMLSTSPHCDAALAEFRFLSPRNTRRVRLPVTNATFTGTTAAAAASTTVTYTDAVAVGRTLLIGSLKSGVAHVFFSGADGRHTDVATAQTQGDAVDGELDRSRTFQRGTRISAAPLSYLFAGHSPARTHDTPSSTPPSDPTHGNALFYEQRFVYVCFSAAPSAVAHCGTPSLGAATPVSAAEGSVRSANAPTPEGAAHPRASMRGDQVGNATSTRPAHLLRGEDAACSSRFYIPLNPCKALVLSPVLTWTPREHGDGDGGDDHNSSDSADPPAPSPEPAPSTHLLRPWMLLTICVVLLAVILSGMLGSFALMPMHVFRKMHRGGGGGNGGGRRVGGGQDDMLDDADDPQRGLLPYNAARTFLLGAGGGGGGGGAGVRAGGAAVAGLGSAVERFGFEDLPDEYEAALAAAGVGVPGLANLGLGGAGWDGSDSPAEAATRRRLLDGKYEVIRKLGKGSFSVVYLVRRTTDGKRFALKYVQCSDDVDRHEAMKECEVVYALQGHPNVIQLFDMFMSYRFDRHMVTVPGSSVAARQRDGRASKANAGGGTHRRKLDVHEKQPPQQLQQQQQPNHTTSVVDGDSSAGVSSSSATTAPLNPTSDIAGAEANPVSQHAATTIATVTVSTPSTSTTPTTSPTTTPMMTAAAAGATPVTAAAPSTESNSNATSASHRAVVHMNSEYLDAMTAGILRDPDASSGATTPHQQRADGNAAATHTYDSPSGSSSGGGGGRHALQAERYLSLVMAYHERGDLARWVRQRRALQPYIPEATIVSIGFQVLSLLAYMHHRHHPPIIHRDLKPENILLTSHVHYEDVNEYFLPIVVTDFGLSRVMDKTFCETGVGSLPYVAPECWQRRYSTKVDIWALGCVLYAVCSKRVDSSTVKVMFSECTQADFHDRLRDEVVHVYGYSPALAWFITALLAVKPDDRPTAAEALRMLRRPATNAAGESVFDGPPLASLLRAASQPDLGSSTSSREPLRRTDAFTATAAAAAAASGGGGAPTPLLLLGDRDVSWPSSETPAYTPDGPDTPMDGDKSATSAPTREGATLHRVPPHLTSVLQDEQQPQQQGQQEMHKSAEKKDSPLQPLHESQDVSLAISHQTNDEDDDDDDAAAHNRRIDDVVTGSAAAHRRTPPSPPASELLTRVASTVPPPSGEPAASFDIPSSGPLAVSVLRPAVHKARVDVSISTVAALPEDRVDSSVGSAGARSTGVASEAVPSTFVSSSTSTAMPMASPSRAGFDAHDL